MNATISGTAKGYNMHMLLFAREAGPERAAEALATLARKAGIEAAAHRVRYYGSEWLHSDDAWKHKDATAAVADIERNIARPLSADDRVAFTGIMLAMIEDLV